MSEPLDTLIARLQEYAADLDAGSLTERGSIYWEPPLLRDEWEESANWEVENSNMHEGQALARCADELSALLVD